MNSLPKDIVAAAHNALLRAIHDKDAQMIVATLQVLTVFEA